MTSRIKAKLKESTSKYSTLLAGLGDPTPRIQAQRAEQDDRTRKQRLADYKARVKAHGHAYKDPARPMHIGVYSKVRYLKPDPIVEPNAEYIRDSRTGKSIPVHKALPAAVHKKMLYNEKRAELGRWCN